MRTEASAVVASLDRLAIKRGPALGPLPFAQLMRLERSRSDRSGREFSMIVLDFAGPSALATAIPHAEACLRCTDTVGRTSDDTLSLLLTETGAAGANTTAGRIVAALANIGLEVRPTVWVYPSRWYGMTPAAADNDEHSNGGGCATRQPIPAHGLEHAFARPLPKWKRALDIFGAATALTIFAPVMLLAALAVRLSSPGPVIFRQQRAGLGGRPFWMLKFRTMVNGAEKQIETLRPLSEGNGPAFKLTHDPRITAVGRWLRKTSVDELPQLINVLRGDMTLVGPRPLPVHESDDCRQWHRERLDVTPGLTCIWQVSGRCNTDFDRWVRMDLAYARRRTLWGDLKLIALTVPAVLLQRGAK